jgi:hypothetical protein
MMLNGATAAQNGLYIVSPENPRYEPNWAMPGRLSLYPWHSGVENRPSSAPSWGLCGRGHSEANGPL